MQWVHVERLRRPLPCVCDKDRIHVDPESTYSYTVFLFTFIRKVICGNTMKYIELLTAIRSDQKYFRDFLDYIYIHVLQIMYTANILLTYPYCTWTRTGQSLTGFIPIFSGSCLHFLKIIQKWVCLQEDRYLSFSLNHDYGRKRYCLILFLNGFVLTNFD